MSSKYEIEKEIRLTLAAKATADKAQAALSAAHSACIAQRNKTHAMMDRTKGYLIDGVIYTAGDYQKVDALPLVVVD